MKLSKSKLPLRIIVLPFVMIITFCYSMWQLFDYWINFVVYGGEFIALNKTRTKATIAETYDKLQEFMDKQDEIQEEKYDKLIDGFKNELMANSLLPVEDIVNYCEILKKIYKLFNHEKANL